MARYFRQNIYGDSIVPAPAVEPLLGHRLARKAPIVAGMRAQDRVVTQSRRVVLAAGLSGATSWLVPNTDPVTAADTHPLVGVVRTVAREQFTLTPGCFLELRAIVGLSGQTQTAGFPGPSDPSAAGGADGQIRLVTTWDDGGTPIVRTFTKSLPPSPREFAAAPTAQGGQFTEIRKVVIANIQPESLNNTQTLRRWCQPTLVTLELQHVGGARVVDCVVVEVPYAVAMESDDAVWCSHVYGPSVDGAGPLIDYPYQRLSETTPDGNRRGGTWQLQDVAHNQAERLGPCLVSWTSYDEDDEDVRMTEAAPVEVTSSSPRVLNNSSLGAYDATREGWSLSAGAYARTRRLNDPVGMPNNGVIPIRLRVYCQGTATGGNSGGVIRFQSGPYEWVEATVASGAAAGWVTAWGHARVGRGPGDASTAQCIVWRTGGSGGFRIWAVRVHHQDRVVDP